MRNYLGLTILMIGIAAGGVSTGCPVGGGCQYKDHQGLVTIQDIQRQSSEKSRSEPADEQLFVFYTFKAGAEAPEPVSEFSESRLFTRREVEQRGIKTGRQFRAKASYLDRGSCNPGPYLVKPEEWE